MWFASSDIVRVALRVSSPSSEIKSGFNPCSCTLDNELRLLALSTSVLVQVARERCCNVAIDRPCRGRGRGYVSLLCIHSSVSHLTPPAWTDSSLVTILLCHLKLCSNATSDTFSQICDPQRGLVNLHLLRVQRLNGKLFSLQLRLSPCCGRGCDPAGKGYSIFLSCSDPFP